MYEQIEKPKENKSRAVANSVAQKKSNRKQGFGFVDNRPDAVGQYKRNQKRSSTFPIQLCSSSRITAVTQRVAMPNALRADDHNNSQPLLQDITVDLDNGTITMNMDGQVKASQRVYRNANNIQAVDAVKLAPHNANAITIQTGNGGSYYMLAPVHGEHGTYMTWNGIGNQLNRGSSDNGNLSNADQNGMREYVIDTNGTIRIWLSGIGHDVLSATMEPVVGAGEINVTYHNGNLELANVDANNSGHFKPLNEAPTPPIGNNFNVH